MENMVLSWVAFKSLVALWGIAPNIRYLIDGGGTYHVWVDFFGKTVEVASGLSDSNDIADFNDNYKPNEAATWVDGKNVLRHDVAYEFTAAANSTTNFDVPLTVALWLWGGDILVHGSANLDGDSCKFQIVLDGTVINDMIDQKFVTQNRSISVASPDGRPGYIPAGISMRFSYTETNGTGKTIGINLVAMN